MLNRLCTSAALLLGITEAGITFDTSTDHSSDQMLHEEYRNRNSEQLTVHMVHHTHDDVGWLKTVDEYYTGINDNIQNVQVKIILDGVIRELLRDSQRRFSYVEMKFFSMWFYRQTEELQDKVRYLVQEGRLELVNAGWSMHDEACPHYEDMIANMQVGHDFAMKEFGVKPRIGWQIDPFGHSNTNARLFAEMGFDAWFFARLDYQDKERRLRNKEMEFIWRSSYDELGSSSQIFTHALYNHYSAPSGFDFDILNVDNPIVIDETLSTFNADDRSYYFHKEITHRMKHYKGQKNLLILMGDDFRFQDARMYFDSSDNLIKYFNEHYGPQYNITLRYSTPSDYIDGLAAENITWPTKYDDMFPYGDGDESYWTGYFTSRANDKEYVRAASHNLMSSNKLYAMAAINQQTSAADLEAMMAAKATMFDVIGVLQHHDAVTGTGKQHVADNYAQKIHQGIEMNNQEYSKLISNVAEASGILASNWTWCQRTNSTYQDCPLAHRLYNDSFVLAVHNTAMLDAKSIQIPVANQNYQVSVYSAESNSFVVADSSAILCNLERDENQPNRTLLNCQYYVKGLINSHSVQFFKFEYQSGRFIQHRPQAAKNGQTITNLYMNVEYQGEDSQKGAEFQVSDLVAQTQKNFYFDLKYWSGQQNGDTQPSGDYIFRADTNQTESFRYSKLQSVQFIESDVKSQFILNYTICYNCTGYNLTNQDYQQAIVYISILDSFNVLDVNVKLFGLPNDPEIGREVTVNFEAKDFDNQNEFWTDSNGLAMQKRILNYRPTWNITTKQNMNITANYYPIQSCISMKSKDGWQMNVMNSRSQGGSVLKPGRIELMQNRRLNRDDWRGMGEALNETTSTGQGITVPAQYYVQLFNMNTTSSLQRTIQQMQDSPLQYFYSFDYNNTQSANQARESNVLLGDKVLGYFNSREVKTEMTAIAKNKILVRLENIADTYDNNINSFKIDMKSFAEDLYVQANGVKPDYVNIQEMTLTGNQPRSEMLANRINWQTVDDLTVKPLFFQENSGNIDFNGYSVTLTNQMIRVFEFEFIPSTGFTQ